ncbi:MAG: hypothetical protein ABII24_02985 [bacterium]
MLVFYQTTKAGKTEAVIRVRGKVIKVAVLEVDRWGVKLGYEADPDVEINRLSVDESKYPAGQSLNWRERLCNWLYIVISHILGVHHRRVFRATR